MKKDDITSLKAYLEGIKLHSASRAHWDPAATWTKFHRDGKSGTGGAFNIETMKATNGEYIARIVGTPITKIPIAKVGSAPPTAEDVVKEIKAYVVIQYEVSFD